MKKLLIATLAFMTAILATFAQPGGGMRMGPGPMAGVQEYLDMDPEKSASQMTKKLGKELELSDEQGTKVETLLAGQNVKIKEIVTEYEPTITAMREEAMAARDENMGDREAMRASMQEIRGKYEEDLKVMRTQVQEVNTETDEEMKGILDESQYESYLAMKDERKENRGGRGRGGKGRRSN